jgi:cold-inducible RNA-binding protein
MFALTDIRRIFYCQMVLPRERPLASFAVPCDHGKVVCQSADFGSFVKSGLTALSILPRFAVLQIRKEKHLKNIFVGNLSFDTNEDAVRSTFESYGSVERVNLITDRETGRARGFGFVEMSNNSEADRAIAELNGRELNGRALNVNEARPKDDRGFGGGNAGGGGRGKGGGFGGQRRGPRY